eukprot:ANDGO_00138.mRNA.1 hypothetical protein
MAAVRGYESSTVSNTAAKMASAQMNASREEVIAENKLLGNIISDLKRKCAAQQSKILQLEKSKEDFERALLDLHDDVKHTQKLREAAVKLKHSHKQQSKVVALLKSSESDARRTLSLYQKRLEDAHEKYALEVSSNRPVADVREKVFERQWRLVDAVRALETENAGLRESVGIMEHEVSRIRMEERAQFMRSQLNEMGQQSLPNIEKSFALLKMELQHYQSELRETEAKASAERDKRIHLEAFLRDAMFEQAQSVRGLRVAMERVSSLEKLREKDLSLVHAFQSENKRLQEELKRWRRTALSSAGVEEMGEQKPFQSKQSCKGAGVEAGAEDDDHSSVWTEEAQLPIMNVS